jgi:acetyl esterase
MAVNPQAQAVLDMMAAANFQLDGDPQAVRDMMAMTPRPPGEEVAAVEDRTLPLNGESIPVRIYRPSADSKVRPVLVWFHGGGWVIGNLDSADFACRMLTNASGCVVVSVDYRLAPEHKFPAAADDCFAATQWVVEHADELGVDASKVAVGGDSAGGNLAAVVAQLAKEAGGPAISYQALVYPVTNFNFATASYKDNAEGYLLTKASMEWFWGHYLGNEGDGQHVKASPLLCADLTGLPPAIVITAEYDPLRDEGEAYADALRKAGVAVESKRYEGQVHGFFANPAIDDGSAAARQVGAALANALSA